MDGCLRDGWMDGHGLVTFHYPLIFMTLSDVMDGWMDGWVGGRRLMALAPSTNTIHSTRTLYIVHCTPCTVQCTANSVQSTLYRVYYERWMDGWVDGHGLVTSHYPFIFITLSDVMDWWMVGMGWMRCHLPLSPHVHDIVRCDGWMDGRMVMALCIVQYTLYRADCRLFSVQ